MESTVNRDDYLEFVEGSSAKFYHLQLAEHGDGTADVIARYGRIGTDGQQTIKASSEPLEKANAAYDKALREKTNKGYQPVSQENDPWMGYIELRYDRGVQSCEIRSGAATVDDPAYISVWIDGDLADDISTPEELTATYGDRFFDTLDDYRAGRALTIDDIWPL